MKMIYKEEIMTESIEFDQIAFNNKKTTTIHWKVTKEELLAAYKNGDRNFKRIELTDMDLSNYDFSGANFTGAYFRDTDMYSCILDNAYLDNAHFNHCFLSYVSLKNTSVKLTIIGKSDLSHCNIEDSNFEGSNIQNCFMNFAQIKFSKFENCLFEETTMNYSILENVTFEDSTFSSVGFKVSDLINVKFSQSTLKLVEFEEAILIKVIFINVMGIYSAFTLNMSSRRDVLLGGVFVINGKIELKLQAGCSILKVDDMIEAVRRNHSARNNTMHYKQYMAAINYIKKSFEVDMDMGKWDYLITSSELNEEK